MNEFWLSCNLRPLSAVKALRRRNRVRLRAKLRRSRSPTKPSIAVLPFQNMSGEGGD